MGIDVELSYLARVARAFCKGIRRIWGTYGLAGTDRLVRFVPNDARVSVSERDAGEIEFAFRLVNLTRRTIALDDAQIRYFQVGNRSISERPVHFSGRGSSIGPRDTAYLRLTVRMTPHDIRQMAHSLSPAHNRYSTPSARVEVAGKIRMSTGLKKEWRPFELRVEQASLSIPDPDEL